jgi:hypothetical protein
LGDLGEDCVFKFLGPPNGPGKVLEVHKLIGGISLEDFIEALTFVLFFFGVFKHRVRG